MRSSALLVVSLLLGAISPARAADAQASKLNVVVILADDLGWADLGCYGSRFHRTPALDKLATAGMRFTDAYAACPVCSPTRAALLTGKTPARLGLTGWPAGPIGPIRRSSVRRCRSSCPQRRQPWPRRSRKLVTRPDTSANGTSA